MLGKPVRRVFLCYTEYMSPKNLSIVIFDGSNFYHKLKELSLEHTIDFDYKKFVKSIISDSRLVACYFCIGKIRAKQEDKKARKLMANQQKMVTGLKNQGFIIQFGYLLKTAKGFHEKGVDVQIARDLMADAFRDRYNTAFLVSSDSDLLPAIEEVHSIGKQVVYVGFKHKPSFALLKNCKKSILLTKEDLLPFCKY